ncbi:MAG TPA: DUF3500 domain-containing protein [Streptosporangiaceae bacterium]|nr:DUF3500 domain-containing protein [Streptosporangiaceae bacterium]
MTRDALAGQMRAAATTLLAALTGEQRELAALPFGDDGARRWLEYRPEPRPGACLAGLSIAARKAAHQLLSTALSDHAFTQAMGIVALEEVLDRKEQGRRGRHSGDYWVAVFGNPAADQPWSWRFEGHHVSVTMTIAGDEVSPAPVFLGANPARVSYAGRPVSRPLAPEEDLARALLDALGPAGRAAAVVSETAPRDIRSARSPRLDGVIEPSGIGSGALGPTAGALLRQLAAVYLDRLPASLARRENARITAAELFFAWEGPVTRDGPHYYRVQGDDLLIEYDNTQDGANHAHTVLRRPRSDFGDDVLAGHYRLAHE